MFKWFIYLCKVQYCKKCGFQVFTEATFNTPGQVLYLSISSLSNMDKYFFSVLVRQERISLSIQLETTKNLTILVTKMYRVKVKEAQIFWGHLKWKNLLKSDSGWNFLDPLPLSEKGPYQQKRHYFVPNSNYNVRFFFQNFKPLLPYFIGKPNLTDFSNWGDP